MLEQVVLGHLHPRTLIAVAVQPISLDGPAFTHMLNACIAALIDAAIPLRTTVLGVSGIVTADDLVLLDPTQEESASAKVSFAFVFDIQKDAATALHSEILGTVSADALVKLEQQCCEAAREIGKPLRKAVKDRLDLINK